MKILKNFLLASAIFLFASSGIAEPLCLESFHHLDKATQAKLEKSVTHNKVDTKLIFRSGIEQKDSSVGCYFGDVESYTVFRPLVTEFVKAYHHTDVTASKGTNLRDFDLTSLKDVNLDPEGKYILSTRVRVARSLSDFPFPSAISKHDREVLEKKVVAVLNKFNGDLKGTYHPLNTMAPSENERLVAAHMLFKSEDRFLESAQIFRDMPDGRGIFYSKDNQFIVWVNEEDHLRIMAMQKGSDVIAVFNRMSKALGILDKKLHFAFDEDFGYLNSCPTNIGTAMRASVHIKLPKISKRADFKKMCESMGLAVRGVHGEHSESADGIFDISNAQRLGKSEKALVEQLIDGIRKLIELEKAA